jgi:uncharacterized protein YndB with AHSA1/START domain
MNRKKGNPRNERNDSMNKAQEMAPQETRVPDMEGVLVLKRTLAAPPEKVFAAWTRPEMVRRWFSPGALAVEEAELDVRVGGSYRIVMLSPEGEPHSPAGVYEEVVPNEKLVFSWKWADSELVTRVTVELEAVGEGQTELTLTHEGFPDEETQDAHDLGWAGCLVKLPAALEEVSGGQPTEAR